MNLNTFSEINLFSDQSWPPFWSRALWLRDKMSAWPACQTVLLCQRQCGSEMVNQWKIQSSRPRERILGDTTVLLWDRRTSNLPLWLWMFNVSSNTTNEISQCSTCRPFSWLTLLCCKKFSPINIIFTIALPLWWHVKTPTIALFQDWYHI